MSEEKRGGFGSAPPFCPKVPTHTLASNIRQRFILRGIADDVG